MLEEDEKALPKGIPADSDLEEDEENGHKDEEDNKLVEKF